MKKTISHYDWMREWDESYRAGQFSRKALSALWDYYEDWENDAGEELELDIVAVCCEFSEYESIEDYNKQNNDTAEDWNDIDIFTIVLPLDNGGAVVSNW